MSSDKAAYVGLVNLGNSCYMNSVLQALKMNTQFIKKLINIKETIETDTVIKHSRTLFSALLGRYRLIKPSSFKRAIEYHNESFASKTQQDAHEFFIFYIDLLSTLTKGTFKKPVDFAYNKLWTEFQKEYEKDETNTSVFEEIFHGYFIVKYTCRSCGLSFQKFEKFNTLFMDCKGNKSIGSLIDSYFEEGYTQITCKDCCKGDSEGVEHYVHRQIYTLPNTLCILLNRFDPETGNKKECSVSVTDTIDLCEFYKGKDNSAYKLVSSVIHEGSSIHSGHYFTLSRIYDKEWKIFDDDKIHNFNYSAENVSELENYMLFYTLQS